MDQWTAHDHQPLAVGVEERRCHAVWKCGRCFRQMSRPFDCVADVPAGAVALMSPQDAETYPEHRRFGVPIEACDRVPASVVWIRTGMAEALDG